MARGGADLHDLQRFVEAQQSVYHNVLSELSAGHKRTHWMWFVFPQVEGLGISSIAHTFAIRTSDEARAYLDHPLLGVRLTECVETVLNHPDKSAHQIFGSPDDHKFRSSMTLFTAVGGGPSFQMALDTFYDAQPDGATLSILKRWEQP